VADHDDDASEVLNRLREQRAYAVTVRAAAARARADAEQARLAAKRMRQGAARQRELLDRKQRQPIGAGEATAHERDRVVDEPS